MINETDDSDGAPGAIVVRASDGDMLVILDGVGLDLNVKVDVAVEDGFLTVAQSGRVMATGPAGDDLVHDLGQARSVSVMESFAGATPDDDTFTVHRDPTISLPRR